jgi:plasmid stability protein
MAQLVVRDLEDSIKTRLQRRARRNGRSMEEEVRDILRAAAKDETAPPGGLGTQISRRFAKIGLDSDIAELRGHTLRPATFER